MKRNLFGVVIAIFAVVLMIVYACNKSGQEAIPQNPLIASVIKQFNATEFNNQFGVNLNPDFSKSTIQNIKYNGSSEQFVVTPIIDNTKKIVGKIYTQKLNENFHSLFIYTNDYNYDTGNGSLSYMGVGIDNSTSLIMKDYKISDIKRVTIQKNSNSLQSLSIKPIVQMLEPPSSCIGSCYKKAKDACDADPDCKILCDNLPTCNASIVAACAWHCIF